MLVDMCFASFCSCFSVPQFRTVMLVDMGAYKSVVKSMAAHVAALQALPAKR